MVKITLNSEKINNQNNIKKKRSDLYNKRVKAGASRPHLRQSLLNIGNDKEIESTLEFDLLQKEQTFKIFIEFINAKFSLNSSENLT